MRLAWQLKVKSDLSKKSLLFPFRGDPGVNKNNTPSPRVRMRITRALAPLGLLPLPAAAAAVVGTPLQAIDTTATTSSAMEPRQAGDGSGGNLKQCRDVSLVQSRPGLSLNDTVSATCHVGTAEYVNTLNLNECLGVDPATLELGWGRAGQLSSFCWGCELSELETGGPDGHLAVGRVVFSCVCYDYGQERATSVRLDDGGIESKDGVLACRNGKRATAIRMNPDAPVRTEPGRCNLGLGDMGYMDCIPKLYDGKIVPVGERNRYGSVFNDWRGD
ncbi:hypothetical protein MCOR29_004326 [Pyricularia oryzae]|nr:hypothetical protein MCOR29_004326 [Pyricularia oryzae]KAI6341227.1 hypothetical protein MCOR30_002261 [Pyricularia oryzae]KAI6360784.1 hypothetical protein MCOR32_008885 [Pyricularia oryzae]KAI6593921.1 hypothetical protein MCOR12_007090 [Pyricularia oryzae]